ncbi:MAG: EF-P 5-aminopentanol modification-associated protein YfmF [Tumebacillaceae bacterium]
MSEFQTREERGIHVHVLSTQKYKMNTIVATLTQELREETATGLALLPYVLVRGSENYPTPEKLQLALDDLYGASLYAVIDKKGERQLVDFTMTVPNEKFLSTDEPLFGKALDILASVMTRPLTVDGAFSAEHVNAEKEQHKKRIEAVLDDKIQFARERCLEEMTKGEPYSIPGLGRESQLASLDPKSLYELYQQVLRTAPLHVYVVGDVTLDEVAEQIFKAFSLERATVDTFSEVKIEHEARQVNEVVDRLDVGQGKLNIGFWSNVAYSSPDYPALVVANGIFGTFPHSKLFVNVREKNSLCYYCSSRLDALKGIIYVQSGVEFANMEKARDLIIEQLEVLKKGEISEEEMSFTINGLINGYKTSMDAPTSMADNRINGLIAGLARPPESMIEALQKVTKEDVIRVAQGIRLDTVYMLRGKEESAHA